ncbi:MAG: ATP-binding cassette domain-containing protein [Polyangiaceae bacterium]|nr:ATP-binding cassette domain-containing protein [Polyangiaceae bacterium]
MRIEARGLTKRYGDVVALDDVSAQLTEGRITALLGENGAGKSTLLRLLAGLSAPTSGELVLDGVARARVSPAEARRLGIGVVHQHFSLVPSFDGLKNLMLGDEPVGPLGVLRPGALLARAERVMRDVGLEVDLGLPAEALSVGERQRLEILRVLVRGATTLLFDEPTATQTRAEAARLYAVMRRLADDGATVAVVTHHLDEVSAHADEVVVLRRGARVFAGEARGLTTDELARLALGAAPPPVSRPPPPVDAPVVLALDALGAGRLVDVSLEVRRGEIVGVAGVDGNGQDELVELIAGLAAPARGRLSLDGAPLDGLDVAARRSRGLGVVHGDRHALGIVAGASVHDNLVLGELGGDEAARARQRLVASGASPARLDVPISALSGGNQQKVVLARALGRPLRALVVAHPTRGVDAAAAAALRARLAEVALAGCAVLLVSADLAELRALSHRLVVLCRGRVTAALPPDVDEAELGRAMLGGAAA